MIIFQKVFCKRQSWGRQEKDGEEGRMGRPGYIRTNLLSPLQRACLSACKRNTSRANAGLARVAPDSLGRLFLHKMTRFTLYFLHAGGGLACCTNDCYRGSQYHPTRCSGLLLGGHPLASWRRRFAAGQKVGCGFIGPATPRGAQYWLARSVLMVFEVEKGNVSEYMPSKAAILIR